MDWLIFSWALLIIGLLAILIGASFLTEGASALARRWGISEFVIGLTIVGFGTSAPELAVSFFAALRGNADIAVGNVMGSNICNILLILGLTALLVPVNFTRSNLRKDIPISIGASILFLLLANDVIFGFDSNILSRVDGMVMLLCFVFFMYFTFRSHKNQNISVQTSEPKVEDEPKGRIAIWAQKHMAVSILLILIGLAILVLGGNAFLEGAIGLARHFMLSERVIGITLVAVGTSLPELATSLVAAYKGKSQMALGNIIGSNIFNLFLILGISSTMIPLKMNHITFFDMSILLLTSILLFLFGLTGRGIKRLDRTEGAILLIIYLGYTLYLIRT